MFRNITRQQIGVWHRDDLPHIYAETDILPSLGDVPALSVNEVIAMTRNKQL